MTEQVLALSLADELERYGTLNNPNECADELRKLYEENVRLEQALKMGQLNYHGCMEDLKEAEKAQGEPVAWLSTDSIGERYLCFSKPDDNDPVIPLFATPQPQQWVGLTETDLANCDTDEYETARRWERLLREKNGSGV